MKIIIYNKISFIFKKTNTITFPQDGSILSFKKSYAIIGSPWMDQSRLLGLYKQKSPLRTFLSYMKLLF